MPSTYSTSLRLELIGNGEQAGNWGNTNNINLGTLLEQAIAGVENVAISGTSYTLTTGNGVSDQARNAVIVLTGALSANCNVIVPSVDKTYTFRNATTGGFSVVVKTAAGSGVTIANGYTQNVYCDATNVIAAGAAFNNTSNTMAGNLVGNVIGNVSASAGTAASPSVSFSGDPDTGVYNPGPNQLAITTGGAVRFLVDASSYVGVNTLTPARQLEVASANNHMRFSTPGDATAYYDFGRDNIDGLFFFDGAQPTFVGYKWQINGTERLRLSATGQLLASSGTMAAPAYSFTGDPDTGFYQSAAGQIAISTNGSARGLMDENGNLVIGGSSALQRFNAINSGIGGGAPASSGSAADPNAVARFGAGAVVLDVGATLAGAIWLQARAAGNYATNFPLSLNPNGGGVNMVGPVNVTSGGQTVTGDLEASGNLRFNSGYGSAAIAYGVRAWVNFNGTGTVAIRASGNVTSITDNGTGDYTINFTNAMPDANYAVLGTVGGVSGASVAQLVAPHHSFAPTTSSLRILTGGVDSTAQDRDRICVAIVR